jgi:hypothetical protein
MTMVKAAKYIFKNGFLYNNLPLDFNSQVALSRALDKPIQLVFSVLFLPTIFDMLDVDFVVMCKVFQVFRCNG